MKRDHHPKFLSASTFSLILKKRVDDYFKEHNLSTTATTGIWVKSFFFFALLGAGYWAVFFSESSLGVKLVLAILLGAVIPSNGFNIGHDALHGAFAKKKFVNELLGSVFSLLGISTILWKIKHNVIHHTYPNVHGSDDDIEAEPMLRFHEDQRHRSIHRYQQYYYPFAYGALYLYWIFFTDFKKVITKEINHRPIKLSALDHVRFVCGKAIFATVWIVIPIVHGGVSEWLICFLPMACIAGMYMSSVFQMAHSVEEAEQPLPTVIDGKLMMQTDFFGHQLRTTANFAATSKVAAFLWGGLNQQIEHHLFPKVSHGHYPALRSIVIETCKEYGEVYVEQSLVYAWRSHNQLLKKFSVP